MFLSPGALRSLSSSALNSRSAFLLGDVQVRPEPPWGWNAALPSARDGDASQRGTPGSAHLRVARGEDEEGREHDAEQEHENAAALDEDLLPARLRGAEGVVPAVRLVLTLILNRSRSRSRA